MKCLITKLHGVVENNDLPRLGCIKVSVKSEGTSRLKFNVTGNGVTMYSQNKEKVFVSNTDNSLSAESSEACSVNITGTVVLFITNKYAIETFDIYKESGDNFVVNMDFDQLKYSKKITKFGMSGTNVSGDISALSGLIGITELNVLNTKISGDISALSGMTGLTSIKLGNSSIEGDISALVNMTKLTSIDAPYLQVSGDISALSGMTGLTNLNLPNTQVSGDISALSGMTKLITLSLGATKVTGSLTAIRNINTLQSLLLYKTAVYGNISLLSDLISMKSISLNESSVSGDITSSKKMISLESFNIGNLCTGNFKTLCEGMRTQGRNAGKLSMKAYGGSVKVDDSTAFPNNAVVATFTSSGITYSGV
jgi:hypothetical protein